MPGQSGFDVAKEIRRLRRELTRPVLVAISGQFYNGADRILAKMVGFDRLLAKPCGIDALLAALAPLSLAGR